MKIGLIYQSRLLALHARLVEAIVSWLTPKRLRVYPTAIAVLTLLTWMVSQAIGPGLTDASYFNIGIDFQEFYMGGRFFLEDRMEDLYDFLAQQIYQQNLVAPARQNTFHPFVYPPFSLVLYLPFALGDYLTGLYLWWGAGLLALTLSVSLLRQALFHPRAPSVLRLVLTSLLFYPTLAWFMYGQNTAFTLLLYALVFIWLRRKHDFAAGIAAGLLLYKPQLAIALGVVLLIKWRWRALLGIAVAGGVLVAIGFLISPAAMINFVRLIPRLPLLERILDISWGINSFFGFSALLLDHIWQTGADLLAAGLTVGSLIYLALWWRRISWQPGTRVWDLGWAATFALGLLISPQLFFYDLMLLLLPLGIVWSYYLDGRGDRPLDGGPLLAWTAVLYTTAFVGPPLSMAQLRLFTALGLPRMALQVGVPAIVAWAWVVSRRAQSSATSSNPVLANG